MKRDAVMFLLHVLFLGSTAALVLIDGGERLARPQADWSALGLAALLYAAAHLLRYARLLVLLMERRPSYRGLFIAHFLSAWVGAMLPFRLGEAYRLILLGKAAHGWRHGLAAYVVEKFFDAAFILGFVVLTLSVAPPAASLVVLLTAMTGVVSLGVAAYAMAAGSIDYTARALLLNGRSPRSLWLLHAVAQARELHLAVRSTVQQRGLPLLGLTLAIWALDFLSFRVLASSLAAGEHWSAYLETLQVTLRSASTAAGGTYAWVVLMVLSIAAAGGGIAQLFVSLPQRRHGRVRPYLMSSPRTPRSHG